MVTPGAIVYLHGMAGGHLADRAGRKAWLSAGVLARGELGASLNDASRDLHPAGHVKLFHRPASLYWRLARGFRVYEFAYDWRRSLDEAAASLGALIASIPAELPVRIVAHSMGGCVALRFSVLDPGPARRVERAWFLGVPVHGSFEAVNVLLGRFRLQRAVAAVSLRKPRARALDEIRQACRGMAGVVELLPDPVLFPQAAMLYDNASWPAESAPGQALLDRSLALKRSLPESPLLERTIVMAAQRWPTAAGVERTAGGDVRLTAERIPGDGVTPLVSARTPRAAGFELLQFPHAFLMMEPAALRAAAIARL